VINPIAVVRVLVRVLSASVPALVVDAPRSTAAHRPSTAPPYDGAARDPYGSLGGVPKTMDDAAISSLCNLPVTVAAQGVCSQFRTK
jgi:hypothetical protein